MTTWSRRSPASSRPADEIPFLALSHAELASLNELLENGDTASTYVARALRLSGNDSQLIEFLAQVAVQTGDRGLAAQCWRKQLRVNPSSWSDVADEAAAVLSTDELLSDVVADGHGAVRFAEALLRRRRSAESAISAYRPRSHDCRSTGNSARRSGCFTKLMHGRASISRDQACERMTAALALEPDQANWREDYVAWLLAWGRR